MFFIIKIAEWQIIQTLFTHINTRKKLYNVQLTYVSIVLKNNIRYFPILQ